MKYQVSTGKNHDPIKTEHSAIRYYDFTPEVTEELLLNKANYGEVFHQVLGKQNEVDNLNHDLHICANLWNA